MNKITSIGVALPTSPNTGKTCGGAVVNMDKLLKVASNKNMLKKIKMRTQCWISYRIRTISYEY